MGFVSSRDWFNLLTDRVMKNTIAGVQKEVDDILGQCCTSRTTQVSAAEVSKQQHHPLQEEDGGGRWGTLCRQVCTGADQTPTRLWHSRTSKPQHFQLRWAVSGGSHPDELLVAGPEPTLHETEKTDKEGNTMGVAIWVWRGSRTCCQIQQTWLLMILGWKQSC